MFYTGLDTDICKLKKSRHTGHHTAKMRILVLAVFMSCTCGTWRGSV